MNKLKVITFDITGTLLKLYKPPGVIYADVANNHGMAVDGKALNESWYKTWALMNKNHPNYGLYSNLGWTLWWERFISLTFKDVCSEIGSDSLKIITSDLMKLFSSGRCWSLNSGSLSLLEELEKRNMVMGIISNFDPRLNAVLRDVGIQKYFRFVITSYECSYLKPSPKIFELAGKCYESVSNKSFEKSCAFHVGDSYEADYLGAKNAGWNAALLASDLNQILEKNSLIDRDMVFIDLFAFKKYLLCETQS